MTETDAGTDSGADLGGDPDAAESCPEGTEALDGECVECVESGLVISVLGNRRTFSKVGELTLADGTATFRSGPERRSDDGVSGRTEELAGATID